jgi:tetratricopeptide (TPR) repeat protein
MSTTPPDNTSNSKKMERFTQRARKTLALSQHAAEANHKTLIEPHHVLLGLMQSEGSIARRVLLDMGVQENILTMMVKEIDMRSAAPGDTVVLAPRTKRLLELAVDEARRAGHHFIGTEHLLLGVLRSNDRQVEVMLQRLKLTHVAIRAQVRNYLDKARPEFSPTAQTDSDDDYDRDYVGGWWYEFTKTLMRLIGVEPRPRLKTPLGPRKNTETLTAAFKVIVEHGSESTSEKKETDHTLPNSNQDIHLKSVDPKMYTRNGTAYIRNGAYESALQDFNIALSYDGLHTPALIGRAVAEIELMRLTEVLADIKTILEKDPNHALAYALRATVFWLEMDSEKALQDYETALNLDNALDLAYSMRGRIHLDQHDLPGAEANFQKCMALSPRLSTTHSNFALLKLAVGDLDQTRQYANAALGINPRNEMAHYCRGKVAALQSDVASAIADYQQALKYWLTIHAKCNEPYFVEIQAYLAQHQDNQKPEDVPPTG